MRPVAVMVTGVHLIKSAHSPKNAWIFPPLCCFHAFIAPKIVVTLLETCSY